VCDVWVTWLLLLLLMMMVVMVTGWWLWRHQSVSRLRLSAVRRSALWVHIAFLYSTHAHTDYYSLSYLHTQPSSSWLPGWRHFRLALSRSFSSLCSWSHQVNKLCTALPTATIVDFMFRLEKKLTQLFLRINIQLIVNMNWRHNR